MKAGGLQAVLLTSRLGFCPDVHCQVWDLIWTGVCLSISCPVNWIKVLKHPRAKTKPWGWRIRLQSSETGLRRGTDLGKGTKTKSAALKVPKNTVVSIILKWKFGRIRTSRPAKLSNSELNRNHSGWDPEILCGDGRNFQKDNHHCSTQSGQTETSPLLSNTLSPVQYHLNGEAWWWQHDAVGMFFSGRDWGTGQGWGKAEGGKVQRYPSLKRGPQHSVPQTGLKVYLPTGQWP